MPMYKYCFIGLQFVSLPRMVTSYKELQDFYDLLNTTLFYLELVLWCTKVRLIHAAKLSTNSSHCILVKLSWNILSLLSNFQLYCGVNV